MYNIVQTGQKIQFGGLKNGLFKSKYQLSIEFKVKYEETNQTKSGNKIDNIILVYLFIILVIIKINFKLT